MYTLANGVKLHKKYPDTFKVPSINKKKTLKEGDLVKCFFQEEGQMVERMWVIITKANYPDFEGTLDNEPCVMESIKAGDIVKFHADNITSTWE